MKILINVSSVTPNHRGMGSFTKKIVQELLKTENNNYEYIFVTGNELDENFKSSLSKNKLIQFNIPLPIFEQIIIPFLIIKYKADICWFPSNTFPIWKPRNTRFIATIHDIIFLKPGRQKNLYQKIGKLYRSGVITYGINKLNIITSVSKTSLNEIIDFFKLPTSKFSNKYVLYNSIDIESRFDENIIDKLNLNGGKFIYTISGSAYNKNLEFLIKAFTKFNENREYKLVISGLKAHEHYNIVDPSIIFTNYISNSEKNSLLKNCDIFIFASLEEGFGIPLIEAMYFNNNILVSHINVFKEIGSDKVFYFDPTDDNFLVNFTKKCSELKLNKNNQLINEQRSYIHNTFNNKESTLKLLKLFGEINEK